MSVYGGPKIKLDGIVLHVEPMAFGKTKKDYNSLLNIESWYVGNNTPTGFSLNGSTSENERIIDFDAFGQPTVVWQSPSNDATSDADGGWASTYIAIDNTKTYRFSTWVRKKDKVGNGRIYLGLYAYNANNTNIGVLLRANTQTVSTNPYFTTPTFADMGANVKIDEWYLIVGHVLPVGTANGTANSDTGIWKKDGTKVYSAGDFIWQTNTAKTLHRSYQFYSTTTDEKQQWFRPRVDVIDGNEPSLSEMLSGVGFSVSPHVRNDFIALYGNTVYSTDTSPKYFELDGITGYCSVGNHPNSNFISTTTEFTIESWFFVPENPTKTTEGSIYDRYRYSNNYRYSTNDVTFVYVDNRYDSNPSYITTSMVLPGLNPKGSWNSAVITYTKNGSGANLVGYINGKVANTVSATYGMCNNYGISDGFIGKSNHSGGSAYNFEGKIGLLKIYEKALTANEVKQNFNAMRARFSI